MSQLYIAHHGILGQKWGKRNGPPYPLDSDQKSTYELRKENGMPRSGERYSAKKQKKYNLVDVPSNKNAAWDNASEMWYKGASEREIKKYLKKNGIDPDDYSKLVSDNERTWARGKNKEDKQKKFDETLKKWTGTMDEFEALSDEEVQEVVDYVTGIAKNYYNWYEGKSSNHKISPLVEKDRNLKEQIYAREKELEKKSGKTAAYEAMPRDEDDAAWQAWMASAGEASSKYKSMKANDSKLVNLYKQYYENEDTIFRTVVSEAGLKVTDKNVEGMKALLKWD